MKSLFGRVLAMATIALAVSAFVSASSVRDVPFPAPDGYGVISADVPFPAPDGYGVMTADVPFPAPDGYVAA